MYKSFVFLVLLFFLADASPLDANTQPLTPLPQQGIAAHLTAKLISQHHYKPMMLDDDLSKKVFDAYIKSLDNERLFFLQSDIDRFDQTKTKFDDAILSEDMSLPFEVFNIYLACSVKRFAYARELLKKGFDFQQNETYEYIHEGKPWAKSEDELNELWRKKVKNDWLQLKISGKDDKNIIEQLDKRYQNFLKRINKLKAEDAFQIFMNAYTMSIDPHTNFMAPRTSEDFDISMKLSLVGIGAVLEEKDDYATIKELVAGSPAALSEKLKAGDRIAGVAQGENGIMTDVVGWRLDDTVALIRGAPDSVVVLDVIPVGGNVDTEHKHVTLIRKKIKLEDQAAKKTLLQVKNKGKDYKVGVISLPGFYEDFAARQKGEADFKSATKDVATLLDQLKLERVDAVVVDLRNNGGGSLTEAIELTGLFLGTGPVVQQRDAHGEISVAKSMAPGAIWSGPMAVLINRASASASEIFAAAIQDYGRGLIIGETSFGKGTVQSMISLDQLASRHSSPLGDVKLTIAQFFRINGSTTQLKGVSPDISLIATADAEHFGESSYESALPAIHIRPADYRPIANLRSLLSVLHQRHSRRIVLDQNYQSLLSDVAEFTQKRKKNNISLNETERRKDRASQVAKLNAREMPQIDKGLPKPGAEDNKATLPKDSDDDTDRENDRKFEKNLKDTLLNESANIVADYIDIIQKHPVARH